MLSGAQIDRLFTYHPPRPEQIEKYVAIKEAYLRVWSHLLAYPDVVHYQDMNDDCKELVRVMCANCPPSADLMAAVRCVRLVRNAFNAVKFIRAKPGHLGDDESWQLGYALDIARTELLKAKWQANAAIALHKEA